MMKSEPDDSNDESSYRLKVAGRVLFSLGILLMIARGLKLTLELRGLPPFWYFNQATWIVIGIVMIGVGSWLLWYAPMHVVHDWRPGITGRRFKSGVLYVSDGCHLCHDAADLLSRYQKWLPNIEQINIHSDPTLSEQFGHCVPVVVFDGKVRFRGRVNETLLQRLIEGAAPVDPV